MSEQKLFDKLQELKAQYNEALPNMKVSELSKWRKKIKDANVKYIAFLVDGCEPCPNCDKLPHAIKQPTYYEIGCLGCKNPQNEDQVLRVKGFTRLQAVTSWNNKDYWLK